MEHAANIVVCGMTVPVALRLDPGKAIARSPDFREVRSGEGPCEALAALALAVEERIHRAMVMAR